MIIINIDRKRHILFSAHRRFSRVDHGLATKQDNKCTKIEIIQRKFLNQNGIKLKILRAEGNSQICGN